MLVAVLVILLLLAIAAIVALAAWGVWKTSGRRGRRGRRCCPGAQTGEVHGRASARGVIPYAMNFINAVNIGVGDGAALVGAFGGEQSSDDVVSPIDPTNPITISVLNSYAWAAPNSGRLTDFQAVFPLGFNDTPGMTLFAQVWQQPACNGPWTGTNIVASRFFPTVQTGGFCLADHAHVVPFGPGDRIAVAYSTDTGLWQPSQANGFDGLSAGLTFCLD